ncbi:MAG: PEP-CTERM sorting domain-containing protein [Planctomycetota bacterium]
MASTTTKRLFTAAGLAFLAAATAFGVTTAPTDWTRPVSDADALADLTSYQKWGEDEGFSTAFSAFVDPTTVANVPEALTNPFESASSFTDVNQINPGAFVTSGGNIYSPGTVNDFVVEVASPTLAGGSTSVFIQIRTLGSPLDLASFEINGTDATALPGFTYTELARVPLGGFGGEQVDHLVEFTAPGVTGDYTLGFTAAATSLSLDILVVDSLVAVPEPSMALGVASLGGLLLRRRR